MRYAAADPADRCAAAAADACDHRAWEIRLDAGGAAFMNRVSAIRRNAVAALLGAWLLGVAQAAIAGNDGKLPDALAGLLAGLDAQQSRRVSGNADDAAPDYSVFPAEGLRRLVNDPGSRLLLIVGRRGTRPQSPFEIEKVLEIAHERPSGPAAASGAIQAFRLDRPAGAALTAELGRLSTAHPQTVAPASAWRQIADSNRARFVVQLEGATGAAMPVVRELIIVPDSVRITVAGKSAAVTTPMAEPDTVPEAQAVPPLRPGNPWHPESIAAPPVPPDVDDGT
ncbi:MAG: hypothetical protein ACREVL_03725 [Solimonas sp.]